MSKFGTSQSVPRKEDMRFLVGTGRFMEDVAPEGALHAVFFRSPVAHGRIDGLDLGDAASAPGVVAVYAAADLDGKLENAMDFATVQQPRRLARRRAAPADARRRSRLPRRRGDRDGRRRDPRRSARRDRGDRLRLRAICPCTWRPPRAARRSTPRHRATSATTGRSATRPRSPAPSTRAAHATRLELIDNRVMAMPMEARGCFAEWDGARLHVGFSGQGVWGLKDELLEKLGLPPEAVRVTTPDVGGGFGIKGCTYPGVFPRRLRRPRARPAGVLDEHPRRGDADRQRRPRPRRPSPRPPSTPTTGSQAIRITCVSNLGAYNAPYGQHIASSLALKVMPGVYDVQKAFFAVKGVFTNTTPLDAYRGAGRPGGDLRDRAADGLVGPRPRPRPVELRRRNFIPTRKLPLPQRLRRDLRRRRLRPGARPGARGGRRRGLRGARKARARRAGKLRGLGSSYYIELILGDQNETTTIAFAEDGMVELAVGTQSNGQGHETVFAQILAGAQRHPLRARSASSRATATASPRAAAPAARAR